jgi:hypothetical protein
VQTRPGRSQTVRGKRRTITKQCTHAIEWAPGSFEHGKSCSVGSHKQAHMARRDIAASHRANTTDPTGSHESKAWFGSYSMLNSCGMVCSIVRSINGGDRLL